MYPRIMPNATALALSLICSTVTGPSRSQIALNFSFCSHARSMMSFDSPIHSPLSRPPGVPIMHGVSAFSNASVNQSGLSPASMRNTSNSTPDSMSSSERRAQYGQKGMIGPRGASPSTSAPAVFLPP